MNEPTNTNEDQVGFHSGTKLRLWTPPSGAAPLIELQCWVTTGAGQQPIPLPWVRMTQDAAAEFVNLIAQTIGAARGLLEPPSGPMQ
jgi:hypothetical protein